MREALLFEPIGPVRSGRDIEPDESGKIFRSTRSAPDREDFVPTFADEASQRGREI